jgi:hypothetical protein
MKQHTSRIKLDRLVLALAAVALLPACGGSSTTKSGPCEREERDGCGATCSSADECESGLFCAQGTCDAECASATAATDCSSDQACSRDGRCIADQTADDGGANGSNNGAGNSPPNGGGNGGENNASGGSGNGNNEVCADVTVRANVTTPNVMLIVDQSGSMTDKFGDSDRWTVLKNALLSDTGLIAELQNQVRFGIALYTWDDEKDPVCPAITPQTLSFTLGGLQGIRDIYMPAVPGDNTPTGESVEAILTEVEKLGVNSPDATDPTIFILATDGNPDTCDLPDQGSFGSANSLVATKKSIDAVKKAYQQSIRTFVIAVAGEADLAQSHVNDLANAGVGDPAGPGMKSAPSYRVNDDKGLRDALRTIVTGELSCDVVLEGKVTGDACLGTVALEGTPIPCNDANGWSLVAESTIRLAGTSCDALKSGKTLNATFPCDVVVVQ